MKSKEVTNQFKELTNKEFIKIDNWEQLKDWIWKVQMRMKDLEDSRDKWKDKYNKLNSNLNRKAKK